MDRKIGIFSMLTVALIFGFYGAAWAGMLLPPECRNLPAPSGPVIDGVFTVAKDAGGQYQITVILKRGDQVRPLRFTESAQKCLCPQRANCYTAEEFKEIHKADPCLLKFGEMFGLRGVPVIETLKLTGQENCEDDQKAMISGTVTIRVVPVP